MLQALKFVQGAVARRDFVPEMTHFVIEKGTVRAFNGVLALSCPIDLDIACAPKAAPMVKAIAHCDDVVSMGLTDAQRLRIQSGPFKAFIDCVDMDGLPHQQPEGEYVDIDGEHLLEAIKVLLPFVGDDATRPWTNGILLRGQSAFATNNVCLVEYWLGQPVPFTINIPMAAINEIARIGQVPTHAQMCPHSITIHYADGQWIRTQLFSTDWPDLSKILDAPNNAQPVPEGLFEGLEYIKGFADVLNHVHFIDGKLRTHEDAGLGAAYTVEGLHHEGIYRINMLAKLDGIAETVDFTAYPSPLLFYGHRLRGAIIGMRK